MPRWPSSMRITQVNVDREPVSYAPRTPKEMESAVATFLGKQAVDNATFHTFPLVTPDEYRVLTWWEAKILNHARGYSGRTSESTLVCKFGDSYTSRRVLTFLLAAGLVEIDKDGVAWALPREGADTSNPIVLNSHAQTKWTGDDKAAVARIEAQRKLLDEQMAAREAAARQELADWRAARAAKET